MSLKRQTAAIAILGAAVFLGVSLSGCERPTTKSETPAASSNRVAYNSRVDFSKTGNAASIKVSGWSKAEDKFTWSEGNTSVLSIDVAPTPNPVTLRVTAAGMIKEPEFPTHPVEVYVNDQKIADWQVGNTAPFSAPIPPDLTKAGGTLTLTFKMPRATSPKELGKSEDPRVLGICISDLELTQG